MGETDPKITRIFQSFGRQYLPFNLHKAYIKSSYMKVRQFHGTNNMRLLRLDVVNLAVSEMHN